MAADPIQPVEHPVGERVVPLRHPGRWLTTAVILLIVVAAVRSIAKNSNFEWHIVGHYVFSGVLLRGLVVTLELTALAMAIGLAGGIVLAVMRLSPNPIISSTSWSFIWFFRGTPVLVQLYFWFFLSALYPKLSFGIPFGPTFVHGNANVLITKFVAASLALGLNESAYMGEIVRAGIISVDSGQTEAAGSLGFSRLLTMRRIILPQAMRVIVPPLGNETISMLKTTSLVSVIALVDLFYAGQQIYAATYQPLPILVAVSIDYLIVTSILYIGQYFLERRFGRGAAVRETLLQRAWRAVRITHVEPVFANPTVGGPA